MSAAVVALISATIGCSHDTAATPTTASTTRSTETFSGTVVVAGRAFHTFSVTQTGQVDLTLTAATPSTVVMGVGIGLIADATCVPLAGASAQAQAGSSPQLSGKVSPGTLCAEIHDVGSQTAPVAYTLTVTHP